MLATSEVSQGFCSREVYFPFATLKRVSARCTTLKGDKIVAEFIKILDDYVDSHYAAREKEEVGARG